jgi:hypothetical protein
MKFWRRGNAIGPGLHWDTCMMMNAGQLLSTGPRLRASHSTHHQQTVLNRAYPESVGFPQAPASEHARLQRATPEYVSGTIY